MADHASALKRHRQSQRRRSINQKNQHRLKTEIRKLKQAIAKGSAGAKALLPKTFSIIDKSVQKGVIKKNTANRYKSRLAQNAPK